METVCTSNSPNVSRIVAPVPSALNSSNSRQQVASSLPSSTHHHIYLRAPLLGWCPLLNKETGLVLRIPGKGGHSCIFFPRNVFLLRTARVRSLLQWTLNTYVIGDSRESSRMWPWLSQVTSTENMGPCRNITTLVPFREGWSSS